MKNSHHFLTLCLILTASFTSLAQQIDTEYETQKKSILKMEFFSPLTGHTTFGYERYIKDWVSWEAKLGIIGLGVDQEDFNGFDKNSAGLLLRGGPKFKLNPDFVTRDLRGSHLLSGKYIRPEIVASVYSEDEIVFTNSGDETIRKNYNSFALLINYGRQYVLADIMSIDYHVGVGYGFDNYNGNDGGKYHHSHTLGDSSFPIAFSAGFTIGVLLK
ncbi:MAG: hypothetical protein AB8B73_08630 [Ekhidna sp.]